MCAALVFSALFAAALPGRAAVPWTPPTPDELMMTAEPKAPGAAAIILTYEQTDDPNTGSYRIHERIKILTDAGASAGSLQLPVSFPDLESAKYALSARVISPSGVVHEYSMDPKTNAHIDDDGIVTLTLPNVEKGVIIEFFLNGTHGPSTLLLGGYATLQRLYEPYWEVQQKYFVRSEHFDIRWPDDLENDGVHWTAHLPGGLTPHREKSHLLLDATNVPAIPNEVFMPPRRAVVYNVDFYFYPKVTDYWSRTGGAVDDALKDSITPGKGVRAYVQQLIQPGDTDDQKLHRLYNAVQGMENTGYTREHSRNEEKKSGEKTGSHSDDILERRRGTTQQLAMLFIAMAKAAGLDASPFMLISRNRGSFQAERLSWSQFDSMIVVVSTKSGERLLDPGTPYCPYGLLAPNHALASGLVLQGKNIISQNTELDLTHLHPDQTVLDLKLEANGTVTGALKIQKADISAMQIRQRALRIQEDSLRTELEKETQKRAPDGMTVALTSIDNLTDSTKPVLLTFSVSGHLGTATSRRLIVPAFPLEAHSEAMLPDLPRSTPVAFPTPFATREIMHLELPPGYILESTPKNAHLRLSNGGAEYITSTGSPASGPPAVNFVRAMAVSQVDYPTESYGGIQGFFSAISTTDHTMVSLIRSDPTASSK